MILKNPSIGEACKYVTEALKHGKFNKIHVYGDHRGTVVFTNSLQELAEEFLCLRVRNSSEYSSDAERSGNLPEDYYRRLLTWGCLRIWCFEGYAYGILVDDSPILNEIFSFLEDALLCVVSNNGISAYDLVSFDDIIEVPLFNNIMPSGIYSGHGLATLYASTGGSLGVPVSELDRFKNIELIPGTAVLARYCASTSLGDSEGIVELQLTRPIPSDIPESFPYRIQEVKFSDTCGHPAIVPVVSTACRQYAATAGKEDSYKEIVVFDNGDIANITDFSDIFLETEMPDADLEDHKEKVASRYARASEMPWFGIRDIELRCALLNIAIINHPIGGGKYENIIPDRVTLSQQRSISIMAALSADGVPIIAEKIAPVISYFSSISRSQKFGIRKIPISLCGGRYHTSVIYLERDLLMRRNRDIIFQKMISDESDVYCTELDRFYLLEGIAFIKAILPGRAPIL